MGYRTSAQPSSYVPAHPIFLPAGYPAIDDRGGTMSRLSSVVVSLRATLVADLGKNIKGKKIGHRGVFPVY
ncbi:hypothetical protein [Novipirellula rosea]|uniref:hypothetical protein n=1 Tax=Novipirellula rosea TaxID=1031540 RepID=UPI0031EA2498